MFLSLLARQEGGKMRDPGSEVECLIASHVKDMKSFCDQLRLPIVLPHHHGHVQHNDSQ